MLKTFDAAGDGTHVSRTMICRWNQRFKNERIDIFDNDGKGRPQEIDTV